MQKPTNSAAEQIVNLRSINSDLDIQIATLQDAQRKNLETIEAFEEIATWEDVPDEVVEEELPMETQESASAPVDETPVDPEPAVSE